MIIKPNIRYDLEDLERFLKHIRNWRNIIHSEYESEGHNWTFFIVNEYNATNEGKKRYYIRNEKTHEVIFYYADTFLTIKAKDVYHKFKWKK